MKTSEQINEIISALCKAQKDLRNPDKNKTAKIPTKAGGKYEYSYADLPNIFDKSRAVLAEHGLAHSSATELSDGKMILAYRLMHVSGQWIESEIALPFSDDPKVIGGYFTYYRRYLFSSLIGIAAEEDLDSQPEDGGSYGDKRPAQVGGNEQSSAAKQLVIKPIEGAETGQVPPWHEFPPIPLEPWDLQPEARVAAKAIGKPKQETANTEALPSDVCHHCQNRMMVSKYDPNKLYCPKCKVSQPIRG